MSNSSEDLVVGDPLSEVARKDRKWLLMLCILDITIVKAGLVPQKISALGIEFDQANQEAILYILAAITTYFLVAFLIYASADFLVWRRALFRERLSWAREHQKRREGGTEEEFWDREAELHRLSKTSFTSYRLVGFVSVLRIAFEFLLPVLLGLYSTSILL